MFIRSFVALLSTSSKSFMEPFFVWIPDSGRIFKVRSPNGLVKKSKLVSSRAQDDLLIIQSSLLALIMLIEIWSSRNRLVSKITLRSISSVLQRICELPVLEIGLFMY